MNDHTPCNADALIDIIRRLSEPRRPIPTDLQPVLAPLENIRAVLFDIYGTLVVSGSGDIGVAAASQSEVALVDALHAVGLELLSADSALGEIGVDLFLQTIRADHAEKRGRSIDHPEVDIRQIWRRVLGELDRRDLLDVAGDDEQVERLAVEYECRVNPVWPMPQAMATLQALHRSGKVLGIVSNAQFFTPLLFDALLDHSLGQLDFEKSACVYSYQLGQAKPSTAMFEQALQSLTEHHAILPSQVLYVGNDMLNDIFPASRLGCRTALFAGDRRSLRRREDDSRCTSLRSDLVVCDLPELVACLDD